MFEIPMSSEPCLTGILVDQEFNPKKGGNEMIFSLFHPFTYYINYYLLFLHNITHYLHLFYNFSYMTPTHSLSFVIPFTTEYSIIF